MQSFSNSFKKQLLLVSSNPPPDTNINSKPPTTTTHHRRRSSATKTPAAARRPEDMMFTLKPLQKEAIDRMLEMPPARLTEADAIDLFAIVGSLLPDHAHLANIAMLQQSLDPSFGFQPLIAQLPKEPFNLLIHLFNSNALNTELGVRLRLLCFEKGTLHETLNLLAIYTHQMDQTLLRLPRRQTLAIQPAAAKAAAAAASVPAAPAAAHQRSPIAAPASSGSSASSSPSSSASGAIPKGTGFGSGNRTALWDIDRSIQQRHSEAQFIGGLFSLLCSYVNPEIGHGHSIAQARKYSDGAPIPVECTELLQRSCLLPLMRSYLINNSLLDIMPQHDVYRWLLMLMQAIACSGQLVGLLLPPVYPVAWPPVHSLLAKLKNVLLGYANRLKPQPEQSGYNGDDVDKFIRLITATARVVQSCTEPFVTRTDRLNRRNAGAQAAEQRSSMRTHEQAYIDVMKRLQFDTIDIILPAADLSAGKVAISHLFADRVRSSNAATSANINGGAARVKRLAQELATLSHSLPLSYESTVFVCADTSRLDIMKALIIGPADTPYANGCFVFDVYCPPEYPHQPLEIRLETTGRNAVRFNPNLYPCGKVCLSMLNTWTGRPEEMWNAQTSSVLQVLVSIQSLIMVEEPYFNEPGFETCRGSAAYERTSARYNADVFGNTVRWAMAEQLLDKRSAFRRVIEAHFWLKRTVILADIERRVGRMDEGEANKKTEMEQYPGQETMASKAARLRTDLEALRKQLEQMPKPKGM